MPELDHSDSVAGKMEFDPKTGVELDLMGTFRGGENRNNFTKVRRILGETTDGKLVTLQDCTIFPQSYSMSDTTSRTERCEANKIFVGANFKDEPEFDSITLTFPNLNKWTGRNLISPTFDEDVRSYNLQRSDPVTAELEDAKISLRNHTSASFEVLGDVTLQQSASLRIDTDSPLNFNKLLNSYIQPLQQFVSLGQGQAVVVDEVKAHIETEGENQPPHVIDIAYTISKNPKIRDTAHPSELLFTLEHIDFDQAINSWFTNFEQYQTLHSLYFAIQYQSDMYQQNEFLSLITGLESYHRERYEDDLYMPKEDYNDVVSKIDNMIDDSVPAKSRIVKLLESGIGNEPSLKDRLDEITEEHEDVLDQLMDIEQTVKDARDLRHSLAHGLSSDSQIEELVETVPRLTVIVEVCLLSALDLEDELVIDQMNQQHSHELN